MEFVGVTRLVDGVETDQFVATCPDHNYYYKGAPPITHGCRECWAAFFISQWAQAGAKQEYVDQLESAIHHVAEAAKKGEFNYKPDPVNIQIDKEI